MIGPRRTIAEAAPDGSMSISEERHRLPGGSRTSSRLLNKLRDPVERTPWASIFSNRARDATPGREVMKISQRIAPCLWFDDQAEDAAKFYTEIFANSRILKITRFGETGREFHHKEPGTVMTVAFELDGLPFTALNGGPMYQFNEAISLQVNCESQDEVDYYWEKLGAGGDPKAQMCGWLKDQFGVSWQVVPTAVHQLIEDPDSEKCRRATAAMFTMKKLDIDAIQQAYNG